MTADYGASSENEKLFKITTYYRRLHHRRFRQSFYNNCILP